ncbi:MAG: hypothetical protein HQ521_19525 [Bacteroidetes bacterium]|nr:hypothetical protein [Bacteroidota bacterium]
MTKLIVLPAHRNVMEDGHSESYIFCHSEPQRRISTFPTPISWQLELHTNLITKSYSYTNIKRDLSLRSRRQNREYCLPAGM